MILPNQDEIRWFPLCRFSVLFSLCILTLCTFIFKTLMTTSDASAAYASHKAILAFGDSLTAGTCGSQLYPYAKYLQSKLPTGWTAHHIGMPGWTTGRMLMMVDDPSTGLRFHLGLQSFRPSLCIILAGTNDIGWGEDEEVIFENLKHLHQICHKEKVRSLAVGIPDSAWLVQHPEVVRKRNLINDKLEALSRELAPMMSYVPFPFEFDRGENWCFDGLHFSKEGYKVLGESLASIVEKLLE